MRKSCKKPGKAERTTKTTAYTISTRITDTTGATVCANSLSQAYRNSTNKVNQSEVVRVRRPYKTTRGIHKKVILC